MRGKNSASEVMPPVFGLPPAIQKILSKQASACAAESALVALESLTNSTSPMRPTSSMRCARPGNDHSPSWMMRWSRPSASAAAVAQAAFCALCGPRNEPMSPRSAIGARRAAGRLHDLLGLDIKMPSATGRRTEIAHDALAGALDPVGNRPAPIVVDADDGRAAALARRRRAAPSPRRNDPSCRGDRDDLR